MSATNKHIIQTSSIQILTADVKCMLCKTVTAHIEAEGCSPEMIKDTGADAVVTICPFCKLNLQDGLDDIGCEDVKTMHILELLDKAYE